MNCRRNIFAVIFCLFLVAGCGTSEDTTNTVPQAEDPNGGIPQPLPDGSGGPSDDRLPGWVYKSAPISLSTSGNYTQLEQLVLAPDERLVLPVVGDPLISLELEAGRTNKVKGKLFIGVEDKIGLAWREWSSIHEPSTLSSTLLDGFFLDDEVAVRIWAPISSNKYSGTILYRFRQSGETQCTPTPKCHGMIYANGNCSVQWTYEWDTNDVNICRDYLNSNLSSQVKNLGTFEASTNLW